MLTILMGRAKTGKSEQVLRRIGELGDSSRQILLVPEHASHQAEVDLCRACGDTASRHAEVLSLRRLCRRVLTITGGAAQVTIGCRRQAVDPAEGPGRGGPLAEGVSPSLSEGVVFTAAAGPLRRAALLRRVPRAAGEPGTGNPGRHPGQAAGPEPAVRRL